MKLKQIRVDGYKNLIDCKVDLGDFNVLVGANNSGKSNLLEAIQMLGALWFGDQEILDAVFDGMTPPDRLGTSICHLEKHRCKPMTFGVLFELYVKKKVWIVTYNVTVQLTDPNKKSTGFISEVLTAKQPSTPGPAKTYISRKKKKLEVCGKSHPIGEKKSAIMAIESLYPNFDGLPIELKAILETMTWIYAIRTNALSPAGIREDIDSEKPISAILISSFDILLAMDELQKEGEHFDLLIQQLCEILDMEDIHFRCEDLSVTKDATDSKGKVKRTRILALKRAGCEYSFVEEYSDGTLIVIAMLTSLLSGRGGPLFCVEELENCLHPAAIEKLLRFLQDHADKWPVLITTHSSYLLNGVRPEDVNVAVVDKTGATHFENVENTKQLRDYLNKGLMNFGDLLVRDFEGYREK